MLLGSCTAVDRVVGPRVMSKAMGVSPLFVMFAAFAGAELMGFWGMILGVPVAAAMKVLFRYVRRRFLVPQEGDLDVASMMVAMDGSTASSLRREYFKAAALEHPKAAPVESVASHADPSPAPAATTGRGHPQFAAEVQEGETVVTPGP